MDKKEFIDAITKIESAALNGLEKTLITPPGRKPLSDLLEASTFYNNLNESDKIALLNIAKLVSHQAINNMLSILDGNIVFESTDGKGDLELNYIKDSQKVRLNTPQGETLSDLYKSMMS